jgi:predicted RNase H-like HicB family nuclease
MKTTKLDYKIILEPDPEAGGYVANCPALPGCYSQGDTKKEAISNIREAIEGYIESLRKDKLPIPGDVEPEVINVTIHA